MVSVIRKIGYKGWIDFFLRLVLPVLFTTFFFAIGVIFFLELPFWVPLVLVIIGLLFIILYPVILVERQKVNIHENIHLFITYAGTISTIDLDRSSFFRKIAAKKKYGYISQVAEKTLYLAKEWNLGFAQTLRHMAKLSPSRILGDFLDRFAATMDFGGDMRIFLQEEQDAVLNDYANQYQQALNNIQMLREVFIAITISVAFAMSIALLLPLLEGISILVAIRWALLGLILVDMILLILIKGFIPSDNLCHNLKHKDDGMKRINRSFWITLPLALLLAYFLFNLTSLPFLIIVAISVTPFLITGFFASREENDVYKRDKAFPSFIRALGSTIHARQGGVVSSLQALRVHDFGVLNDMVINLYKRLKLGNDRDKSWYFFAAETGSNLINYFVHIFAEGIYLGGHAQRIGELISNNFSKLLNLRNLRLQQASGLRGALYGSLVGFIATIYISVSITNILSKMFSGAFSAGAVGEGGLANLVSSVVPQIPEVNMATVGVYLGILIIVHSFVSSMVIKMVDGGHKMAFFFDFVIMLWIGAILSVLVPFITNKLFLPAITGT